MKQLILVFLGGGLGSALRFYTGKLLNNYTSGFPYGTFTANILGSFLIGFILGYVIKNNNPEHNITFFLVAGFCGGFTTFSAFAYENYTYLKSGDITQFILYTTLSIGLGLAAVFAGILLAK